MQKKIHGCTNLNNGMNSIFNSKVYQEQLQKASLYLPAQDKCILITGATGLIGSCLIDCLMYANIYQGRNFKIYALGRNAKKLELRFEYAKGRKDLQFVVNDVCNPVSSVETLDYIIHAASNADPKSYAQNPSETLLTNILGTKSVLDYAKKHKKCRILFTSTFEVYGKVDGELTEDSYGGIDFHKLRNSYPFSKICAELLCYAYAEQFGVDYVIARLGGIYGPTMNSNDSKAQASFLMNALKREDIVMKSKGEQTRSYCYVIDAVTAMLVIATKGASNEAYNIADENSIVTIAEFAQQVAKIGKVGINYEMPSEIERKGYSKPTDIIMRNDKLKTLGWEVSYGLIKGIESTLQILSEQKYN